MAVLVGVIGASCGAEALSTPSAPPSRQESPASKTAEVGGFRLELLAPRPRLALGEPATLIVVLQNVSPEKREVLDLLAPEYGFLHAWIRRPGEERETAYAPPVRRDSRGEPLKALGPGERIHTRLPIYYGREGWLLGRPGRYRVRAEYSWAEGSIASAILEFEVTPPESEDERKAAALMMDGDAARFLYLGGGGRGEEGRKHLETLAREHPQSRLAPYARLALGLFWSRETFDPATKSFRPADSARAAEDLQWAVSRLEDPVFAAAGAAGLARSLRALGREKEAVEAVERFFERHARARELPGVPEEVRRAVEQKQ